MDILIGRGVDKAVFGQSENQLVENLGLPNKKYFDEFGDIYLKYNALETTFKFDKQNDYKLYWIETSNIKFKVHEFSPWKTKKEDLIPKLTELFGEQPELEDYGNFESVTYNHSWVEFQFEYGNLKQINFGVSYDKDNNPDWPDN